MKSLSIGSIELPIDFATQTAAILARKRVGKTYTASVIAEEMVLAGVPFVALDPTGAWWGLRAAGKGAGLPVMILGGSHGDVPIEPTAGKVIADLVVDHPGFYVIDLSATESNAQQDRFAMEFAERLYRRKESNKFPMHLFVDEADAFAPQRPMDGQQRMLGSFEAIVRRGGIRGIGVTMITQRPAVLNKNVLTQIEVLIALQMSAPQDQDAVDDWIKRNGTKEQRDIMMNSLASLQRGEAWLWSPSWLQCFHRIKVRERRTFNSSATPEVGQKIIPPSLVKVDIQALGEQIKATVEKAKENDPAELKREIAKLKSELAKKPKVEAPAAKTVEIPVLTDHERTRLTKMIEAFDKLYLAAEGHYAKLESLAQATNDLKPEIQFIRAKLGQPTPTVAPRKAIAPPPRTPTATRPKAPREPHGELDGTAERSLDTIAMLNARGIPVTKEAVARWMGIHPNGGRFNTGLASLRDQGFLSGWDLTDDGNNIADAMPTGIDAAINAIRDGTCQRTFQVLVDNHPNALTKDELAEKLGIHPNGGRFNTGLAWLRDMGLISERSPISVMPGAFA